LENTQFFGSWHGVAVTEGVKKAKIFADIPVIDKTAFSLYNIIVYVCKTKKQMVKKWTEL